MTDQIDLSIMVGQFLKNSEFPESLNMMVTESLSVMAANFEVFCHIFLEQININKSYLLYRALELKEHAYFKGTDWTQVYLQKYPPPLIPPRGEVNAADAFDIGSFDEEDTKGIKVRKVVLSALEKIELFHYCSFSIILVHFSLDYSYFGTYSMTALFRPDEFCFFLGGGGLFTK